MFSTLRSTIAAAATALVLGTASLATSAPLGSDVSSSVRAPSYVELSGNKHWHKHRHKKWKKRHRHHHHHHHHKKKHRH